MTWLLNTSSKREITLSLGIKQVFSRKCSIPILFICSVNFLLMISRATGTLIMVKRSLTSKVSKGFI